MGEVAALLTSLCWAVNTIQFTLAGQRVGSEVLNRTRLILAAFFLFVTHLLLYGRLWPGDASLSHLGWLGLSGVLGLVLADGSLFQAFLLVGPRLATVIQTLVPVFSTLVAVRHAQVGIASTLMGLSPIFIIPLARVFFHEKVSLRAAVGTVVALAGATVILLV